MVYSYIAHISSLGRFSASVRRTAVRIAAVHFFNRMTDPTKDPGVRIAMKRKYHNPVRVNKQAYGIRQKTLNLLLTNVGDSIKAHHSIFRGCNSIAIHLRHPVLPQGVNHTTNR